MTALSDFFSLTPTSQQSNALNSIGEFLENDKLDFFILSGSAGTGKTTLLKAVTDYLDSNDVQFYIAAPTTSAAKIVQQKTGFPSKTIHSLIYEPIQLKHGVGVEFKRKLNINKSESIFIIDESSMISNKLSRSESFVSKSPLLTDLLKYIKEGNKKNKVIFIGDNCQLTPINEFFSPALEETYLESNFGLKGRKEELTEVKRQGEGSYILANATKLREAIKAGGTNFNISCNMLPKSTAALHKYIDLFDPSNPNKITVLAWTNKDVNWFNNAIRDRLGFNPEPLSIGDHIFLNQNWMNNRVFLMKGEKGTITDIGSNFEKYADLNFVNVSVQILDEMGNPFTIKSKVLLESLYSKTGELSREQESNLFAEVMKHNGKFRETRKLSDDKYLGALRLRFNYATTCHKAQGGEWENVILHPYFNKDDLRWQYTAVTRASKELYSFAA